MIENPIWKIPLISNLKNPACASKRDVLEFGTLRYILFVTKFADEQVPPTQKAGPPNAGNRQARSHTMYIGTAAQASLGQGNDAVIGRNSAQCTESTTCSFFKEYFKRAKACECPY